MRFERKDCQVNLLPLIRCYAKKYRYFLMRLKYLIKILANLFCKMLKWFLLSFADKLDVKQNTLKSQLEIKLSGFNTVVLSDTLKFLKP